MEWLNSECVTYRSDDGTRESWIDHILCSKVIHKYISYMYVDDDFTISDHCPLLCTFECSVQSVSVQENLKCDKAVLNWKDEGTVLRFKLLLEDYLNAIDFPVDLFNDEQTSVNVAQNFVQSYFCELVNCIKLCISSCSVMHVMNGHPNRVVGWNDVVKDLHHIARQCFLNWRLAGKPKFGRVYVEMVESRKNFKKGFKSCKYNEDQLKADKMAESLHMSNSACFWKNVSNTRNVARDVQSNNVNGACGSKNIAEMWKKFFGNLYSSVLDEHSKTKIVNNVNNAVNSDFVISADEIMCALSAQKLDKAVGNDDIPMEALVHGGNMLAHHLAVCFSLMLKFSYIPKELSSAVLVPLVKNKGGDLSDVNNYRAIAISTALSKILEFVLLQRLLAWKKPDISDEHQFGFKKGHSTSQCAFLFKKTVEYYRRRGSHVFCCFLDATKAYDRVNYWKLFDIMFQNDAPIAITKLLINWYSNQELNVRWGAVVSDCFSMQNGLRQGSLLSPFLFSVYISSLIDKVLKAKVGCNVAGVVMNILAYADDIVVLAPSWDALQLLLDICEESADQLDILFNSNKSVCMTFPPEDKDKIVNKCFPCFVLNGKQLQFVNSFKYLGHVITTSLSDNEDVNRVVKGMFIRCNTLFNKFSQCSLDVKKTLFKSLCVCVYGVALWDNLLVKDKDKFYRCYNICAKKFFGYAYHASVTGMLIDTGLNSGATVLLNEKRIFEIHLKNSLNRLCMHFSQFSF